MRRLSAALSRRRLRRAVSWLRSPQFTMALPAATLAAFWIWGEIGLVLVALLVPVVYALVALDGKGGKSGWSAASGPLRREDLEATLGDILADLPARGAETAALVVEIDEFRELSERIGHRAIETVLQRFEDRLRGALRGSDHVARFDGAVFGLVLGPVARLDLEIMLQIAGRLQAAIAEAITVDATTIRASVSIGFCQSVRLPGCDASVLLEAAESAMVEARRNGPGAIRAYSVELHRRLTKIHDLRDRVRDALELGHIRPWFQPQISTDTGRVTGFEALARWMPPEGGTIPPGEFLPAVEQAGLMERMGEQMLYHAMTALRGWDRAGVDVPSVGVNLSATELHGPNLADKIAWELDRFEIPAARLTLEILETVIGGGPEDVVVRNILKLAELGCGIDLDDFGTGNASITSIRRFAVSRLKIDRSFVQAADTDQEQQRMVAAILTMAERLGLETLAEGVENLGEHAMLAQLGCNHVQGYAIGRPMPFEETLDWLRRHNSKLAAQPSLGRHFG